MTTDILFNRTRKNISKDAKCPFYLSESHCTSFSTTSFDSLIHISNITTIPLYMYMYIRECANLNNSKCTIIIIMYVQPSHQDVSFEEKAGFDGDADARLTVSLYIAAGERTQCLR